MKNMLTDLRDHLFEEIEWLKDRDLTGEALDEQIKRSLAVNELAKTAVTTGALIIKAADSLYGLPVSDELHLIPPSPSETPGILTGDRKNLLGIPKKEN
ncbi:MAG: hypothetical protein LBI28_08945 [Treponema sp.]|jgi:hypothetical protein|nr:hypothetical protein [Treponema sp.]